MAMDLHHSQEELLHSESRFRRLVESNLIGVVFCDLDGRVLSANDAYLKIVGRSHEDTAAGNVRWDTITPAEFRPADERAIAELKARGVSTPFEKELLRADGARIPVMIGVALLEHSSTECVAFTVDLTELKRAERDLKSAKETAEHAQAQAEQANRLKDEFLATLSHELRTPLNAILGWAQLLRSPRKTHEDHHHGLETIERNARAQAQLIEDLLDISRIVSGKMRLDVRTVDMATVIQSAIASVRLAADARHIRLTESIDRNVASVWGDPDRLQQVTWNLLSNAIKFTPEGGTVTASLKQTDAHVEIAITDSGQGISPEFLPYVFERFRQADASTTRKYGGLGLGLAIVRHLVEQHGGTVRAASAGEDQGARFTVRLPVKSDSVSPEGARDDAGRSSTSTSSADPSPASLHGIRVLVVDDEADTRELLIRMLEERNATVTAVDSAERALSILESNNTDVLVSDIGMPGVDGYELIRRVRALGKEKHGDIPAIALTAFARSEDRRRALAAGYQLHVPKPVGEDEIAAAITTLLQRPSTARSS